MIGKREEYEGYKLRKGEKYVVGKGDRLESKVMERKEGYMVGEICVRDEKKGIEL